MRGSPKKGNGRLSGRPEAQQQSGILRPNSTTRYRYIDRHVDSRDVVAELWFLLDEDSVPAPSWITVRRLIYGDVMLTGVLLESHFLGVDLRDHEQVDQRCRAKQQQAILRAEVAA
jgi:hypothetical protein